MRFKSTLEIDYLVIKALEGKPKTTLDLMDATGLNIAAIYCSLNRLQKGGIANGEFDNESVAENFARARTKYYYLSF